MDKDIAVELKNVSKMFQIYDNPRDRVKQSLWWGKKKFYREFWALNKISLAIPKGRTVGIVGRNGSGKSTLLQILTGTLQPTSGDVYVEGRIAAILELGCGFNPEMTGRENVFLNGSLMSLSETEIKERLPLIEKFAELGEFIDQPVKTYSSGMFIRLAFACAVHVDPDVLIIDEALAVGDMNFQLKCIDKMRSFKNEGKTILFVSHDTYCIKNFCDEVIWLMNGAIHMRGEVNTVTHEYEEYMKFEPDKDRAVTVNDNREKRQLLTIDSIMFCHSDGQEDKEFRFGEPFAIKVDYTLLEERHGIVGGIALFDKNNTYVCGLNTKLDGYELPVKPGRYQLMIEYDNVNLLPGTYFVDVGFLESMGLARLDYKSRYDYFKINESGAYFAEGVICLDHRWRCQ